MDYTPKQAAHYLHNLTTILADNKSIDHTGSLGYFIVNRPATVHDLLLQKSDGKFFLVVWGEKFTGGKDEITITFSKIHRFVNIYDPTTGTLPISTKKRVKSVQLTMSDHPVVVEIY